MKLRISAALWAVVGVSASYSGAEAFAVSTHLSGRGLLRRPLQLVQRQSNNKNHRLMVTSSLSMSSSSSSSSSSSLTGPRDEIPSIDLDTASPQEVDALVQSEYNTWCQTWGKTPDKARYAIFQKNYLMQLRYDQQTGIYSGLNEFGDWTPEEYQQQQQQAPAAAAAASAAPAVSNQDDVVDDNVQDVDVREEYQTWGTENAKEYLSEERYEVFKANFLANQRYFEQTGKYYVLNEFADMTPDEYEAMVMAEGGGGMPEDNGSGLPSYMQGMTTPASAPPPSSSSSSSQAGAGMPSFADSLSGGYSSNKPAKEASYMPKSYKPSSGSGMPSYFDNLGSSSSVPGSGTGSTSGYAPTIEPNLTPAGPSSGVAMPSDTSYTAAAPPTGAGMPSFADSLSGGYSSNKPAKEATYMPKSYKQSSGSGLPSYFDNLGSGGSGSGSGSGTGTSSSSSGTGLPSFADSLSGGGGGGGNQMKPSSYMPKSYKQSSGSGMPSYFDNLGSASDASSYSAPTPPPPPAPPAGVPEPPPVTSYSGADSYSSTSTSSAGPPSGAGMPSFADSLSGGGGGGQNKMKPSSYMPKSYKQSSGSGLPSYFDNMGQPWPAQQQQQQPPQAPPPVQQAASAPPPGALEYKTTSPPPNIRPNIAPSNGIRSDQSAQLARIHSPARGGGPSPGHPLANPMTRPLPLKCDQTVIMREGDAFLPHAQDPVVKRGNLLPDQSNDQRYFFTGRLCATDSFQDIPMGRRFPSDQERVENQTRRTLMYFQKSNHRGRRPTAVAAGGGGRGPARTGAGPPTGAGMPSFADSLSGGNNSNRRGGAPQPVSKKPTNYMPKSYKKSSGSGMPSYFDSLDRPRGGGGSGTGRPQRNF